MVALGLAPDRWDSAPSLVDSSIAKRGAMVKCGGFKAAGPKDPGSRCPHYDYQPSGAIQVSIPDALPSANDQGRPKAA